MNYLSQGEEEALKPRKVTDELEDPEYPHYPDEPNDLSGLPNDLDVFQLF